MRTTLGITVLAAALGLGTATSASALPFLPVNTRQVAVNDAPAGETSLQSALDQIFAPLAPIYGVPDAETDQSVAGVWQLATYPGGTLPALAFEQTSAAATNVYGIWSWSDTLGVVKVPIFLGAASPTFGPSATAFLTWTSPTTVMIGGFGCGTWVNCDPTASTAHYVDSNAFGFYLDNGGNTFYTIDSLNPGGAAGALTYQQGATTNWAIAFEDGADGDYNDGILRVESIQPVPEPGTLMLFGAGALGMAGKLRRRFKRA